VYTKIGTPVTFKESGGDVVITLLNLAFGAGRVSAQKDRGAGPSYPKLHSVKVVVQFTASPAVGDAVNVYLLQSDGSLVDDNVGTSDAALTVQPVSGFIGSVIAKSASGATNFIVSFNDVPITQRYYSIAIWNASATKNLQNTANVSYVTVTPNPDDIQAAA
tara:strand:+ start:167 stop:652 length:486 start_codon:yes stop_codon:yes gene_type:complete